MKMVRFPLGVYSHTLSHPLSYVNLHTPSHTPSYTPSYPLKLSHTPLHTLINPTIPVDTTKSKSTKNTDSTTGNDDDENDEEDYIDIDTEEEFEAVAKGKDFITFADLREWELIQQLREAGNVGET